MKHNLNYHVEIKKFSKLHELPSSWIEKDYRSLLELLDFGDVDTSELSALKEYTTMALQDLPSEDAAQRVLEFRIGESLSEGARTELMHDLKNGAPWEEHADMTLHRKIFIAAELIQSAFPKDFSKPEASAVELIVKSKDKDSAEPFQNDKPSSSILVDILAHAVGEHGILFRLFEDEIDGEAFSEADSIIWHSVCTAESGDTWNISIISSNRWLESFDQLRDFECSI